MLRSLAGNAIKSISYATRIAPTNALRTALIVAPVQRCSFSSLQGFSSNRAFLQLSKPVLGKSILPLTLISQQTQQSRSVTKFSLNKGKRKTVKAVLKRFRRLDWGGWIRTYTGRHKKLFKKSAARKRRLRQHVFVNSTQSWLLDKMVTSFWRRPKNWVDDIYAPYNRRDEFFATKRKTFKV